ncbi:Sec-independent protein translocase protein TatB [Neisseria iguanae]|uniref:Sec-independent protein translocase protein TatB n=1 Tax=Neisseria iguanae TaxID=90242 RepID=A0A2P7U1R5_9NEIS|nr:Sec-independent protein translocase protein TatB [Neisseria iguanae]PSJ80920.1 twin-arginine translocase subunit TatB [Neisseria iguanae]
MFDFGLSELLLLGIIALIVLGPERLPKAARTAGQLVGKLQHLVSNVKQELSVQIELEELRKAKQEFESAADQLHHEMKEVGNEAQNSLNTVSDSLKPWERLPEQRVPDDFKVGENGILLSEIKDDIANPNAEPVEIPDENGQPIAQPAPDLTETAQDDDAADADKLWHDYLTSATTPYQAPEVSYVETAPTYSLGMHTATLRKQAMQRKRDMRPKFRAKPKLRVRKT